MDKKLSTKINKEEFAAGHRVLKALREILTDKLEDQVKKARNHDQYDKPAWSEQQADIIGMQRAYADILELIKEDVTIG